MKGNSYNNDDMDIHHQSSHSVSSPTSQYAKSFMFNNNTNPSTFVNLTLPDVKLKGKQQYKKQPYCTICFHPFTTTFRQHHCRVCVNACCDICSKSMINKQRACDLCIMKYTNIHQQKKKTEILSTLQLMTAYMVDKKNSLMQDLQKIKANSRDQNDEQYFKELKKQQDLIKQIQKQNQGLKLQKYELDNELQAVRSSNAKLQNSISSINRNLNQNGDY